MTVKIVAKVPKWGVAEDITVWRGACVSTQDIKESKIVTSISSMFGYSMSMKKVIMMDWCEWFGFSFDPFFDKPLESDLEMKELLVVRKKAEEQITPLIRQMSRVPFLCLVAGERGVGKSTMMYQSLLSAKGRGFLPVYVGLDHIQLEFGKGPIYGITESLMYELGVGLVNSIHNIKPTFFACNKNMLLSLSRYLFLDFEESEGFFPSGKPYRVDLFELKRYILTILNLLKKAKTPALISIDNLDKVSKIKILRSFSKHLLLKHSLTP